MHSWSTCAAGVHAQLEYMRSLSTCAAGVHSQLEYMCSLTPSGVPSATLHPTSFSSPRLGGSRSCAASSMSAWPTPTIAHGTAYVANSRTTDFATLGFLHEIMPKGDAPGGRLTFINYVLQRALAGGVLCWWARPVSARRSAALQIWAAGPARRKARPRKDGTRAVRRKAARPAARHARSIAPEDCAYADCMHGTRGNRYE
jgi:hypothetical protein